MSDSDVAKCRVLDEGRGGVEGSSDSQDGLQLLAEFLDLLD